METEIKVKIKENYGNKVVYPACDKSQLFSQIAGTKTLTAETINYILRLGYAIKVMPKKIQ